MSLAVAEPDPVAVTGTVLSMYAISEDCPFPVAVRNVFFLLIARSLAVADPDPVAVLMLL
jgi:hypothetical protein